MNQRQAGYLRIVWVLSWLGIGLAGCTSYPPTTSVRPAHDTARWVSADVRMLDPIDSAGGGTDLVAFYARQRGSFAELRLDFLEVEDPFGFDLYISLDYAAGGGGLLPFGDTADQAWDACLVARAYQPPYFIDPSGRRLVGPVPRLIRRADMDSVSIHWNSTHFASHPERLEIAVYLTAPGASQVIDVLGPSRGTTHTPARAPLILAFWDTLSAASPAQALRRWDGAHTGPLGSRHGLVNVIEASATNRIPVFLLDLKTPEALAALDLLGATSRVQALARQGVLILPDIYPGGPAAARATDLYRDVASRFGYTTSRVLFGVSPQAEIPGYTLYFSWEEALPRLVSARGARFVPLPIPSSLQAVQGRQAAYLQYGPDPGLPMEIRTALLRAALSPDPGDLVIIGESLPDSLWGDIAFARSAMEYIAAHPWIWPLNESSLQAFPTIRWDPDRHGSPCLQGSCQPAAGQPVIPTTVDGQPVPSGLDRTRMESFLLEKIDALPDSNLEESAWLAYVQLTRYTADPHLQHLRANYLGQLYGLVLGAEWVQNPISQNRCDLDADLDGLDECVLSSETVFAILDPRGARLTYAFLRSSDGSTSNWLSAGYQVVGPVSQFSTGISDPSTWALDRGVASDPNEIPGAFSDYPDPFQPYRPSTGPGSIRFSSQDGLIQKTFTLLPGGLSLRYNTSYPLVVQVPLALSPSAWYQPDGPARFLKGQMTGGWTWGLPLAPRLKVRASVPLQITTSRDSGWLLRASEDPNRDYPPGHYLPFPLARVDFHVTTEAVFEISGR